MLADDFEAWDAAQLEAYKTSTISDELPEGDLSATQYSFTVPDSDPDYVWARVEHTFVAGDIKTKEEAIQLGMVVQTEEV